MAYNKKWIFWTLIRLENYFPLHTKVGDRKAREAENLARKLSKYRKMWLRAGSLMLYKITQYRAVALTAWDWQETSDQQHIKLEWNFNIKETHFCFTKSSNCPTTKVILVSLNLDIRKCIINHVLSLERPSPISDKAMKENDKGDFLRR